MNEAFGAMIANFLLAVVAVVLLPLSMLPLTASTREQLATIARATAVVSALLLLWSVRLHELFVGFLDNLVMFGFPILGVLVGLVCAMQAAALGRKRVAVIVRHRPTPDFDEQRQNSTEG